MGAKLPLVALGAALAMVLAAVGLSWASHLSSDVEGHTTVDTTICARDPSTASCLPSNGRDPSAFYNLKTGPGEPYGVRELNPSAPVAEAGRTQRRTSLLYFAELTDFQLADEESPARVEFLDPTSDQDPSQFAASAWRPQEALHPQMVDRMNHQVNRFAAASPVAAADGSRAQMAFAINTGDSADSQQKNETAWVVRLLEGGPLDPNSGSSNPADYAQCPPGTPGPPEAAKYTGVQDYDDYVEGADPDFYDPDDPRGAYAGWPSYPGLMDRAQEPFTAEGLQVPSYVALGNHDGLVQGNAAANREYERVATGCIKPIAPSQQFNSLSEVFDTLNQTTLEQLLQNDPAKVALVPPDEQRQYVSTAQYKALFSPPFANQPDGHGFAFVDPGENAASNGAAAYYSWSPKPGFRFIALNTVGEGGVVSDRSSDGNIDDPQFQWLTGELDEAQQAGELVVLFGHHAINSLTNNEPDESAPPCTGIDDGHGHDQNPGCDVDPRQSTPIHLGQPSQRPPGDTTQTLSELLLAHRNVIAFVAGHSHVNQVLPFARSDGSGGFWNIKTAAEADWPSQSRLIDIMDNRDGTLSIFNTMIDHSAPTTTPAPGTDAAGLDVDDMASLNREFAYNDPQKGGGTGEGRTQDRNIELLLPDPRAGYPRPRGATPLYVPLVPAFKQCTAPNSTHGEPLSYPSCSPPVQASAAATVGTPDANGRPARSVSYARYKAVSGDVQVDVAVTDLRALPGLGDYAGGLEARSIVRITDRSNASGSGPYNQRGTVVDFPFPVKFGCTATPDPSVGSTCAAATSFNAVVPGAVVAGDRAIWQLDTIDVYDGGPDGDPVTAADNTLFARQGLFVP
jgi:hypothetical protein